MSPSRQRVTRAVTRRVTLSADSIGLVVASVRRSAPGTPSRTTVSVSARPSRRLDAASGLIRVQPPRRRLQRRLGCLVARLAVCLPEPAIQFRPVLLGDVGLYVPLLADLAPLDHRVRAP